MARGTVRCRCNRTLAINAAGWGGQVPLVPELGRVLSSGLIARDQIPCSVQATTEWYEARHDGRFMRIFGPNVKWPGRWLALSNTGRQLVKNCRVQCASMLGIPSRHLDCGQTPILPCPS
ncbi:hypothetical protein MicloDRAFT_00033500 [Microvirga lotononidis]|uniref:Uncharacterized protein n=1 Tax=Microvirga lotononidis TaxID=864069 RepID=I4YS58_9HYPH|nr:hypothetical protein MicloDRAFT_00033500 [Microvirga lotononidis]